MDIGHRAGSAATETAGVAVIIALLIAGVYLIDPSLFAGFPGVPSSQGSVSIVSGSLTMSAASTTATLVLAVRNTGTVEITGIAVDVSNVQLAPASVSIAPGGNQTLTYSVRSLLLGARYVVTAIASFSNGQSSSASAYLVVVQQ